MTQHRDRLLQIVRDPQVLTQLPEPIRLASGAMSRDFIDGKLAVAHPDHLEVVGEAMVDVAREAGAKFDAVGGIVLGAVPFTFAVAAAARCRWFLIRKEPKGRGTNRWVEGARLSDGMRVMVVEDVITTGGSILTACERVEAEGARVVFATALVDRGDEVAERFGQTGIPYVPLLTYRDLGIDPVRPHPEEAPAGG